MKIIQKALIASLFLSAITTLFAESKRPNILLVLTDDHSVPHVGCYDNPDIKTPNLDELASKGMRFDKMFVTAPQCVPARATIMTGISSVKSRMTRFSAPLDRSIITFPEILRKNGYYTGVVGRIYHLDGHNKIGSEATLDVFEEHNLVTFPDRLDFVKIADGGVGHIDQFVEFLAARDSDGEGKKPWFCQLSFDDPHRPLDSDAIPDKHDPDSLTLAPHMPDTPLVREDFANYYDEISRFDRDFGTVMKILEERGEDNNTVIVFMGDNGAALLRAKGTLYEWGLNVPFIVRWDGHIKPGSVSGDLVTSEDLGPTFLDIAGLEAPEIMEGPSFKSILETGKPETPREYFCAARGTHGYNLPLHTADFDLSRCVRDERFKLIYNPLWQIEYTPVDIFGLEVWKDLVNKHAMGELQEPWARIYFEQQRSLFELYDLEADPNEFENLAGNPEYAEIELALKSKLHNWMVLNQDYVPLPISDFNPFLKR